MTNNKEYGPLKEGNYEKKEGSGIQKTEDPTQDESDGSSQDDNSELMMGIWEI